MKDFLTIAFSRLSNRIRNDVMADDDSADALQDAFCSLWGRDYAITDSRQAENLLKRASRNNLIDIWRNRSGHSSVAIDETTEFALHESSCDDAGYESGILSEVESIIANQLSAKERDVLILRDRNGWDFEELAQRFDTSEANVRMILSRARKKVREVYRKRREK